MTVYMIMFLVIVYNTVISATNNLLSSEDHYTSIVIGVTLAMVRLTKQIVDYKHTL